MKPILVVMLCLCGLVVRGESKTSGEQFAEWQTAAEKGDAKAQFEIGRCYSTGQCAPQNNDEAVKWCRKAADQNYSEAQNTLGRLYYKGIGVPKNETEAVIWWRKAADQGHPQAQCNLGVCYLNGQGLPKNDVEATKWYRKAAEQGNVQAQFSLGIQYFTGQGIARNELESYKWALLASAQGDKNHRLFATEVERKLSPALRAEGQRLAQEWETKYANRGLGKENEPVAKNGPKVSGTGFLITRNGYLVTNYHVVKGSQRIQVQTAAGLQAAEIVRVDAASDLALLKVAGNFDALPVVSSRVCRLGAMVATVGFPNIGLQGFAPKVSKGDVSSLTGAQDDVRYFQISVPTQPGNSGGALVDDRGNVVGVVTAQLSQDAAWASSGALAQNVNYAVKSSYLLGFLESVPEVTRDMLGARTEKKEFEVVVDDVKRASVLIFGY